MVNPVPTLDYDCTTVGYDRHISIALPVFGPSGQWIPTRVFGLEITDKGTFDPGGPLGHPVFDVFTCEVQPCYYVGFAYFTLTGDPSSPALAHIRVMAPGYGGGPLDDPQTQTGEGTGAE